MKPGLTGLWQISGRSEVPRHEAVLLDLYYVDTWSLRRDLRILLKTAKAVATARGACEQRAVRSAMIRANQSVLQRALA